MSTLISTEIPAGLFKAKCLQLMEEVYNKHISLIITKHGKPIAKLVPIEENPIDFFGCRKGTAMITGNIISPIEEKWDAE